ncbi:alanine dehydrogenase [Acholeplasma hippikon]|uniref:Alanine dehydrogenase n=1 Tax=Acholeplasma hippikon TaxID=264636 RepID=A0A449BLG0_9MOLU|nr:alanine dehydrogenase [Acholeplasma hippikon]VEU83262.1 Alanine dehydrogenase 2 [Acholeplasma hippikon]
MNIGCVKEIKVNESRVGLTPKSAKVYIEHGHQVFIEKDAGLASGFSNEDYLNAGCMIYSDPKDIWKDSDMIIKVKEPIKKEYPYFKENLIIYTYLHLAADEELTKALVERKVTAIAYETIQDETGLPCLRPMSEVAGKLSIQEGARYLTKHGELGILLSGTQTVDAANVLIIGGGVSGTAALSLAYNLGAKTTLLDINENRLIELKEKYPKLNTLISNEENLVNGLKDADLVISAVLLPGAKAPKIIRKEHYQFIKKGAVLVDIAIDQGGSLHYSRPTTHKDPIFIEEGIIHYCVANMPGIVPKTSTLALNHQTLPFGLKIADNLKEALANEAILKGLNTYQGYVTLKVVADLFNLPYKKYEK